MNRLDAFVSAGVLRPLDAAFARAMLRLARPHDAAAGLLESDVSLVALGAALASRAPLHGEACVQLETIAGSVRAEVDAPSAPGAPPPATLDWPEPATWHAALLRTSLTGPGGPLTLLDGRLYLSRLADLEARLAASVRGRLSESPVDPVRLEALLERLWPTARRNSGSADQLAAIRAATRRRFSVIVGGPGTGKTTTVVRLLALILELSPTPLRVGLLAPTGKAAARLMESVQRELQDKRNWFPDSLHRNLPEAASTIHLALGVRPDNPARARHSAEQPLPFDLVVVDEASMVSLALMARLLEAVRPDARVILLGDQHQLASVEAGNVLTDLCGPSDGESDEPIGPPIAAAISRLTFSHRFHAESEIGRLARAVNAGDVAGALTVLGNSKGEARLITHGRMSDSLAALADLAVEGYAPVCSASSPKAALAALSRFRLLCAHRKGALSVERLNDLTARWLAARGHADTRGERWHGLPFLITRNDHALQVFNGDTGVFFRPEGSTRSAELMAWLPGPGENTPPRALSIHRLPDWEPVFAMTIHKSQGSEMAHAVVVLPEQISPIVTRELIYTGLTRAKERVTLVSSPQVLREGVAQRVMRASGLAERLWVAPGLRPEGQP